MDYFCLKKVLSQVLVACHKKMYTGPSLGRGPIEATTLGPTDNGVQAPLWPCQCQQLLWVVAAPLPLLPLASASSCYPPMCVPPTPLPLTLLPASGDAPLGMPLNVHNDVQIQQFGHFSYLNILK